jgi:hypothetical protein
VKVKMGDRVALEITVRLIRQLWTGDKAVHLIRAITEVVNRRPWEDHPTP